MPKVLSLKKGQPGVPSKNQKSITHFFKNTVPVPANSQKSAVINQVFQEVSVDKKLAKRKAVSPTHYETIQIVDDCCVKNGVSKSSEENGLRTPKRFKSDHINSIRALKRSPQKENSLMYKQSPLKSNLTPCQTSPEAMPDVAVTNNLESCLEHRKNRSPLSHVDHSNVIENEKSHTLCPIKNIKSNPVEIDNHVLWTEANIETCKKVSQNIGINTAPSGGKCEGTPKKSYKQELCHSPRVEILRSLSGERLNKDELSPSKSGSTVKALDFGAHLADDMFVEQWELGDMDDVDCREDLDLSTMQRCEVLSLVRHPTRLELRLKNSKDYRATCFVEGIWVDTPLSSGEIISVMATRDSSGQFCVGNASGLLALRPDHLMSATSVVAGVFCKRKAVLQERWRGIDPANNAMTIGILIHELVQKALTQNIKDSVQLRSETDNIIKESAQMLYAAGLSEEETRSNMQIYVPPLTEFMQRYVGVTTTALKPQKDQWCGQVDKVLDIEENMCCPLLGLKGKIDATLQVTIHARKGNQSAVVPLELKSGKASVSAEHRGQLVLYGMMLSLQRSEDPTRSVQRGLLLYLKDRVDIREVSCGYPERRDLVMLRNQLAQYLPAGPQDVDPEKLTDIEDAACLLQQNLPEPVHHETACSRCPYLTICSLHLWHTDGPTVSPTHPLSRLREQALSHLSPEHIKYFLHWTALLKMEERGQMTASPLHALWTDSAEKRAKRGTCAANLKLKSVQPSGDRYVHLFVKQNNEKEFVHGDNRGVKGPQEGEFSIVSIEKRPWIAAGVISFANEKEISILLERDLSSRLDSDTLFHIDTYESYATTVQNLTNLGVLLEDSDSASRLRRLIIDKEAPVFDKKLPREVGRLGTRLMRTLNIQQQRAVLRALAAKDYALLQGLPGTGKTQTISVLIQMLVGLKQRVLVTAHTHSAVDTVLSRLPDTLRVMRLGPSARVAACLKDRSEQHLAASCSTVEQLEQLYNSMEVVGVTCLGANHPLLTRTAFDICIVDEATQVLQCTVLRPLFAANRFVLVGDPEQLPPVVRSRAARRLGMEVSLFHRLMSEEATSTLQMQYRMNQALADVANRVAYRSRLICADQKVALASLDIDPEKLSKYSTAMSAPWLLQAASSEPEYAALFVNVAATSEGDSKTCTNIDEACVVLALVDALIEGGVKPTDIGVIAPYRDQVALLRRGLSRRGAEASTVDQFQGRDKSVIVYSCTKRDSQDDRKVKEGEILNDQRRMAVSVTRAKHKLVVVGDSGALQRYDPLRRLIEACTLLPLEKDSVTSTVNKYKIEFV